MTKRICIVDGQTYMKNNLSIEQLVDLDLRMLIKQEPEKKFIAEFGTYTTDDIAVLNNLGYHVEVTNDVQRAVCYTLLSLEADDRVILVGGPQDGLLTNILERRRILSEQIDITEKTDIASREETAIPVSPVKQKDKPVRRVITSLSDLPQSDKGKRQTLDVDKLLSSYLRKKREFKRLSVEAVAVKTQKMSPCNMLDADSVKLIEMEPTAASNAQILGYLRAVGIDDREYFTKALGLGVEHRVCKEAEAIVTVNADNKPKKYRTTFEMQTLYDIFTPHALSYLSSVDEAHPTQVREFVNQKTDNHLSELGKSFTVKWVRSMVTGGVIVSNKRGKHARWMITEKGKSSVKESTIPVEYHGSWAHIISDIAEVPLLTERQWANVVSGKDCANPELEEIFNYSHGERSLVVVKDAILERTRRLHKDGLITHANFEMVNTNINTFFVLNQRTISAMENVK